MRRTKEQDREYDRRYYAEHREEMRAKKREQYKRRAALQPSRRPESKHLAWKRWYEKHKVEHSAKRKAKYHENGRGAAYHRERRRIVQEQASQFPKPEQCEVCGGGGRIEFDHCHQRGVFRGWLCGGCNRALGQVKDDPDRLRKLLAYLERHVTTPAST